MRGHFAYQDIQSLDKLARVVRYLRGQFRMDMARDEAQANLDACALSFRLQNGILRKHGIEITKAEMDAAVQRGRQTRQRCRG